MSDEQLQENLHDPEPAATSEPDPAVESPAPEPEAAAEPEQPEAQRRNRSMLSDLQEERRKRQDLEQRLANLESANQKAQLPEDERERQAAYDQLVNRTKAEVRQDQVLKQIEYTRQTSEEFNDLCDDFSKVVERNPSYANTVLASDNPVEEIKMIMSGRTAQKKLAEAKRRGAKETVKAISENQNAAPSLSEVPGGAAKKGHSTFSESSAVQDWDSVSDDERQNLLMGD